MTKISHKMIFLIIAITLIGQFSADIYLPSIPAMASYFHVQINEIQYTIFYYTVGISSGALFYGPVSDRLGRRPVILFALVLALLGSVLACFAEDLSTLNYARFIQGFALVGSTSVIRAVTRDISSTRKEMAKVAAMLGIIYPLATAIAPVLGGYIEKYSYWRISFVFILLFIVSLLIYCLKKLPETNHNKITKGEDKLLNSYWSVISNLQFLIYNALTGFALCAFISYQTVSSYLLQVKLDLTPDAFGYTNLILSIALIISGIINTKSIDKYGIDKMLKIGIIFIGISGIIFLIGAIFKYNGLLVILSAELIFAMGCGFIYPNASAGAMSLFSKSAGTAGAVYACFQMLGGVIGTGVMSIFTSNVQELLGILFIILSIIGFKLISLLKHPRVIRLIE